MLVAAKPEMLNITGVVSAALRTVICVMKLENVKLALLDISSILAINVLDARLTVELVTPMENVKLV